MPIGNIKLATHSCFWLAILFCWPASSNGYINATGEYKYIDKDNENIKYSITPARRALLNTIRFAEGTWNNGSEVGYRTLYGGDIFVDMSKHPNKIVVKGYSSAAAGAYQFIPSTWTELAAELKLEDFKPSSQDQAALHLVNKLGVLMEIEIIGLTKSTVGSLAKTWASFPNKSGQSEYGQPVKSIEEISHFYKMNLRELRLSL